MRRLTDIRPVAASLYLLPVRTRMPLKFGPETLTEVTCARVKLTVRQTLFSLAVNMTTATGTAMVLGYGAYHALQGRLSVGAVGAQVAQVPAGPDGHRLVQLGIDHAVEGHRPAGH